VLKYPFGLVGFCKRDRFILIFHVVFCYLHTNCTRNGGKEVACSIPTLILPDLEGLIEVSHFSKVTSKNRDYTNLSKKVT